MFNNLPMICRKYNRSKILKIDQNVKMHHNSWYHCVNRVRFFPLPLSSVDTTPVLYTDFVHWFTSSIWLTQSISISLSYIYQIYLSVFIYISIFPIFERKEEKKTRVKMKRSIWAIYFDFVSIPSFEFAFHKYIFRWQKEQKVIYVRHPH